MTLYGFSDPRLAVLTILREALPAYSPARLGTKTPDELGEHYPGAPYALVAHDGTSTPNPGVERAIVRVGVYGETDAAGYALAQTIRALLLAYEGGPLVRSITPLSGPIPTTDPDAPGTPLAYFSVFVGLRPVPIAALPTEADPDGFGLGPYGDGPYGG